MKASSMFPSTYLKQDDLQGRNILVVIDRVAIEEIEGDSGKERKPVLYFQGKDKGLVLNRTNSDAITEIVGSDETDHWHGRPIVLWVDPKVMFGGKRVGGIRIAPVPATHVAPPAPVVVPAPAPMPAAVNGGFQATDDDVPF